MKLLGPLLRHPESLEYDVTFDHAQNIRALDYSRTGVRAGKPRPHWPEMTIYQARSRHLYGPAPEIADLTNPYFHTPDMSEVWEFGGGTIYAFNAQFGHTTRALIQLAQSRAHWARLAGR